MVIQENMRGQCVLSQFAGERNDSDDGAMLIRLVVGNDDNRANALLNTATGEAGQLRQPDFKLLHGFGILSFCKNYKIKHRAGG